MPRHFYQIFSLQCELRILNSLWTTKTESEEEIFCRNLSRTFENRWESNQAPLLTRLTTIATLIPVTWNQLSVIGSIRIRYKVVVVVKATDVPHTFEVQT